MKAPTKKQLARMQWGWRICAVDLTSRDGFRWPSYGWVECANPQPHNPNGDGCPTSPGAGICVAKNYRGVASGGRSLSHSVGLIVGWLQEDVISEIAEKVCVNRAFVLAIFDALKASIIPETNLSNSNLRYSDLSKSNLRDSDLNGSNLNGSNLSGSDLRGSDLRGSILRGSNLRFSNLSKSNLRDSDLSGSDLHGSILSGAVHNTHTIWPDNFDMRRLA